MDDVVAVELLSPSGVRHHVVTFGRIQDVVEAEPLLEIVLDHASTFGLGDAISARICGSLQEAREAPFFFEALIHFGAELAAVERVEDWTQWRETVDREMRAGRLLYYLGDPQAAWFLRQTDASTDQVTAPISTEVEDT